VRIGRVRSLYPDIITFVIRKRVRIRRSATNHHRIATRARGYLESAVFHSLSAFAGMPPADKRRPCAYGHWTVRLESVARGAGGYHLIDGTRRNPHHAL
jgi:hypothetical protein